jgi:hypothetical protein
LRETAPAEVFIVKVLTLVFAGPMSTKLFTTPLRATGTGPGAVTLFIVMAVEKFTGSSRTTRTALYVVAPPTA